MMLLHVARVGVYKPQHWYKCGSLQDDQYICSLAQHIPHVASVTIRPSSRYWSMSEVIGLPSPALHLLAHHVRT